MILAPLYVNDRRGDKVGVLRKKQKMGGEKKRKREHKYLGAPIREIIQINLSRGT